MAISAGLQAAGLASTSGSSATAQTSNITGDYTAMLLRKTLDSQQQMASEMLAQLSGKGQNLDIRV
jgi:hypothetical protein